MLVDNDITGFSAVQATVNSYTEWDPLEEVVVGRVEGAMIPSWNTIHRALVPPGFWEVVVDQLFGGIGIPYPRELISRAQEDLEQFVAILEREGVRVRRPESIDHSASFATPAWSIRNGFCAANPRDAFLVIGDEIIEAPMADRCRYFEGWAYRALLREYFSSGARWTAAPKPQLLDSQYDPDYHLAEPNEPVRFVITEFEPTFDAADIVRCGRDLFAQISHVTNRAGIEWLRRHLGPDYRVHIVVPRNPHAMHIDDTLMPLAPGKMLVNPVYLDLDRIPPILRSWELLIAPDPVYTDDNPLGSLSGWMNMNVLMLDEKRVVVEASQAPTIRALEDWGFEPIPCSFEGYYPFVGSFHCATLDVRRRGTLESYF